MEKRNLDNWIDSFIQYTDETESPLIYRHWVAISTVAACLMRKCHFVWGKRVYPNMYIILVGTGGKGKSYAMDFGREFLEDAGVKLSAESTTREALIRDINNSLFTETDGMKATFHNSITVASSEFTVFLGFKNQQLISDLCDWYDCRDRWYYKTKDKTKEDLINNMWVNIIAGTTPETLQIALPPEAIGGGLTSRIVFVFARKKGKIIYVPPNINMRLLTGYKPTVKEKLEHIRELLESDLQQILMMKGEFVADESFVDTWIAFKDEYEKKPRFQNTPLATYYERRPLHILKLSMIMSAARSNEMILRSVDVLKAIEYLDGAEQDMINVFAGVGQSSDAAVVSKLIGVLAGSNEIKLSKLMEAFYYDTDKEGLLRALATLRLMGNVRIEWTERREDANIFYIKKEV